MLHSPHKWVETRTLPDQLFGELRHGTIPKMICTNGFFGQKKTLLNGTRWCDFHDELEALKAMKKEYVPKTSLDSIQMVISESQ